MPDTEYVSTERAATMLGVSRKAVFTWARSGKFPGAFRTPGGERRGGDWRIPVASIEAFKTGSSTERGDE